MVTFFKPDIDFIKWLINYANGRIIVDIGCGYKAPLLYKLYENDYFRCFGIDPFVDYVNIIRDSYGKFQKNIQIIPFAAKMFFEKENSIKENMLFLFCRPCHGQFVDETYKTIREKSNNEILYIGLEKNLEDDLYDIEYELITHSGLSKDNEKVYKLK